MTEAEWLTCDDPARMLEYMTLATNAVNATPGLRSRGEICTDRKLRLFAAACVRIQYGEVERPEDPPGEWDGLTWARRWSESPFDHPTEAETAAMLRDIFGNPFRQVTLPLRCRCGQWDDAKDGSTPPRCKTCYKEMACPWLTWNDRTVPKLAQAIYDDRAFDRLPILADALEEAGCTNQDILNHCRSVPYKVNTGPGDYGDEWAMIPAGPHVRGCWVVDLLLGKE